MSLGDSGASDHTLLAQAWSFFHRGAPARLEMQSVHVSLGICLAGVLAVRVVWRLGREGACPPPIPGKGGEDMSTGQNDNDSGNPIVQNVAVISRDPVTLLSLVSGNRVAFC